MSRLIRAELKGCKIHAILETQYNDETVERQRAYLRAIVDVDRGSAKRVKMYL